VRSRFGLLLLVASLLATARGATAVTAPASPAGAQALAAERELLTAGVGDGFTFDAATPHARIDYVMSSGKVVARTAAVVTTDASDHLPVVADLALPGKKLSG